MNADFYSVNRNTIAEQTGEHLAEGLFALKKSQKQWSIVIQVTLKR